MNRQARPIEERFWAKVDRSGGPDGCWLWTGGTTQRTGEVGGYGVIGVGRLDEGTMLAHRLSWQIHNGPIPAGLFVLHRCDHPPCVNPRHLWLGTCADNGRDMAAKGRHYSKTRPWLMARGERHGMARLTVADVLAIRRALDAGEAPSTIARRYEITRSSVYNLQTRKTWAHVA